MRGKGTRFAAVAAGVVVATGLSLGSAGAHKGGHSLPDPGGDVRALVPLPAPGKHFGFNDPSFLNKRKFIPAPTVAQLARATGADVIRYEVSWKEVEPVRDRWDEQAWSAYESIDRALARQGIRSLVVLSSTPAWARDPGVATACKGERGCEYPPAIDELDHWRQFAAEVARRLQNPIIETWQEPNLSQFFKPYPNPSRYARMHAAAYKAIKRARPRTPVLLAGTANTQSTDTHAGHVVRYSNREFLRRIYPVVKGKFNGISLHPYPSTPLGRGPESLVSHAVHDARSVQKHFHDRGNDLWITETGVSTSGQGGTTARKQAQGLLASYRKLMTMADVKAVLIHTLFDQTDAPPTSRAYGFGMVHSVNPFEPKRSFCAFNGRAGRWLVGDCKRHKDHSAPGADRARKLRRVCHTWLRPQRSFRHAKRAKRRRKTDRCLVDLLTIEAAKRGRVKKIRRRAAVDAISSRGAYKASRGRRGIKLARRKVKQLAVNGYL